MRKCTIVFQGDSITDCDRERENVEANSGMGDGYTALIARSLLVENAFNWQIYNRGVSGDRSVDLVARWQTDTLDLNPDVLSILIGVNDTWHGFEYDTGVSIDDFQAYYRQLLAATRNKFPHVRVILGEPFVYLRGVVKADWLPEIKQRQAVVAKLAKEFSAELIPYQAIFDAAKQFSPEENLLGDGVHPTVTGHQLMAKSWLEVFWAKNLNDSDIHKVAK